MSYTHYRRLLMLLDLVLVAGLGGIVWRAFDTKEELAAWKLQENRRLYALIEQEHTGPGPKPLTQKSYTSLVERGGQILSGIEPAPEVELPPEVEKEPESDKSPLESLLRVRGIRSGPRGYAFLEPRHGSLSDHENRFFRENQVVDFVGPETVVQQLQPRKGMVVFSHHGEEVSLRLEEEDSGGSPTTRTAAAAAGDNGVLEGPIVRDPTRWVQVQPNSSQVKVTKSGVRSMRRLGADEVLKGHTFSTDRLPDGKPAIRLEKIPSRSVLARGGAKQGDALVSINGKRMTSKSQALSYLKANPDLPSYEVVIMRNGRRIVRRITPSR